MNEMKIISRLPEIGTTIFTVMARMAQQHNAINLSQGFPDFPVSDKLIKLISHFMEAGHNQYAPMEGVGPLRQIVADVFTREYNRGLDPEKEVTITTGGMEALFSVISALVTPGDEIIVFNPAYDSYDPAIKLNGGVPIHINLMPPFFRIDWDEVKSRLSRRTKLIIINTPHNPTGTVLTDHDLKTLEELALKNGFYVLSDEVYERVIFDGNIHHSVLRYPGLASQSAAIFSFGKIFHATGWKVGFVISPAYLMKEIRKTHQFITFSVNTPVQLALAEFMSDSSNYKHLGSFYQKKRDYFLAEISGSSFEPLPCHGSYFQLLSYSSVSSKPDKEMAEWLTKEQKLASIPVSAFYHDKTDHSLLRFCFAKTEQTLAKAGQLLKQF
jgi:methionine transaminase